MKEIVTATDMAAIVKKSSSFLRMQESQTDELTSGDSCIPNSSVIPANAGICCGLHYFRQIRGFFHEIPEFRFASSGMTLFFILFIAFQSSGQRIEIDRLERDFEGTFRDREAYELSQKFIQIDSTYYTGHYFEGLYRYFRASDELGYQNAISPLRKGIELMEKDFSRQLKRTTDIRVYINIYRMQQKYCAMIGLLEKCYQYTGKPDMAIKVLRRLAKKNLVFTFGVDPYATLSWIYHRNRTYSPEKYPFLKGTIEENVRLASKFADSINIVDRRNYRYVKQWFPEFVNNASGNYFHYKDMIYSYLLNVDSAEYCAKNLTQLDYLSKNNYGNLQFIQAKFEKAADFYNQARVQDGYQQKSTKEFDYMESVINIFSNELDQAKGLIDNSLSVLGPTPGFGWNNIAMTRAHYYAGDLEASKKYRDKAANFKELHINSTWGKIQYDRNTLLFQYLYHKQKINDLQFRDKYYWLNPGTLFEMASHYFKQENAHLLLTSELSANPERFLVLYNIFSSENTIFFDEIWEVIKTFNPDYFIELFKEKKDQDLRPGILKYYNYYIARFYLEDGNEEEAIKHFQLVLEDETLEPNYEKLLIARVFEGLSIAFGEMNKEEESDSFLMKFYTTYPQLMPFSPLEMKFELQLPDGQLTEEQQLIVNQLKGSNIEWVKGNSVGEWPIVRIGFIQEPFESSDKTYYLVSANYQVEYEGEIKIEGELDAEDYVKPGQALAHRLFGIELSLDIY